MELWKFGGNELKIHLLELFNKIIGKNQMPQEWELGMVTIIHKKEQRANVKITKELLFCLQLTNYLQT
jgi:alpha-glucosidase (family GH31 glycosyl hydrolase)